jgi:predicted DNA-binding transcriptional regulator YafY
MVTEYVTIARAAVSKSERLLELIVAFRAQGRFTAQELADRHGVSRRTMLRDLQSLSLLGVPLVSTPGHGGGYTLAYPQRAISLQLTADEAIGLVLSYEAFLAYTQSPFSSQSISRRSPSCALPWRPTSCANWTSCASAWR